MNLGLIKLTLIGIAGAAMISACGADASSDDEGSSETASGGAGQGGTTAGPVSVTTVASGGSGADLTRIGSPCTDDAQCGDGGLCLLSTGTDFLGGGPSQGYCSMNCDDFLINGGAGLDPCAPDGLCLNLAENEGDAPVGRCMEACTFGDPPYPEDGGQLSFDSGKCHGRADLACQPIKDDAGTIQASWCRPSCGNDLLCPGAKCDPGAGVCKATVSGTGKLGDKCDAADENTDQCEGVCVRMFDADDPDTPVDQKDAGICLDPCVFNSPESCGGQGGDGLCIFDLYGSEAVDNGPQDAGFCAESATPGDDADCLTELGWFTFSFLNSPDTAVCLVMAECDPTNTHLDCAFTCDDDSDCELLPGFTCQTVSGTDLDGDPLGKRCVDATTGENTGTRQCYTYDADGKNYCIDHDPN